MDTKTAFSEWLQKKTPVLESLANQYQTLSQEQQIWLWIASIAGLLLLIGGMGYLIYRIVRGLNSLLQAADGWRPINTRSWMWVGSGIWLLLVAYQMRHENHAGWSVPAVGYQIATAFDSEGKPTDPNIYDRTNWKNPHAGKWSVTKAQDGMRGLVSDTGTVALQPEWQVIVWVGPGVVAVRNQSGGGLFSPEKGWLFQENDQQRILRDADGGFADDSLRHGHVVIEEPPKWGYAKYKK